MAEKILRDVETVVIRDEDLEEFVIIPVSLNQNKSPVIHVEHNLGLESWCVKHVYSYAYKKILEDFRK
ncbi:tempura [Carabus blaptoides fortunei]